MLDFMGYQDMGDEYLGIGLHQLVVDYKIKKERRLEA